MQVTKRDIEIFKAVYSFGFLTSLQIAVLFSMHLKVCQRRLRILVNGGYLRKVPIPTVKTGRSPHLFYLGRQAETMLQVRSACPRLDRKMSHAMHNADILISAGLSCKEQGLECALLPEHLIRVSGLEVIPDGAFKLKRNNKSALFLLENCAGTEIVKSPTFNQDIETKIIRYTEMFEKNEVEFYRDYFENELRRFRLLYITNSSKRFEAISKIVFEHEIHGFVWLSTMSELNKGICADIWSIPASGRFNVSIIGE